MEDPDFSLAHCRVAVVGLGLMGGSLALALKGHCRELIGLDASPEALAYALQHQVINEASTFESVAASADLIILATPVRSILAYLEQLTQSKLSDRQPVILDIGSTKTAIVAAMQDLPSNFQPIGGHPMCGKETGGIQHADAELYRNKTFVLCPLARTSPKTLALAQEVVRAVGANVLELDAEQHDIFAALISHLPYTVATALMRTVIEQGHDALWQMAASGFRDTTRLAASDLAMMSDILLTNRAAVLKALAAYKTELDTLTNAIESGDATTLRSVLEGAQHKRSELFK
jgi:prephenate dehydrogenase